MRERNVLLAAILPHDARRGRREPQQELDSGTRAAAGTQLHDLPEQDERRDHRRRLEVDGHRPLRRSHRAGKDLRRERGDRAVGPCHAHAEGDQGEHVQAAVDERGPAALEERPTGPQHHWRREHELDFLQQRSRHESVGEIRRQVGDHRHDEHRRRQHDADPEPSRHVDELRVLLGDDGGPGLERHAADRARSRLVADDLRVHGADVLGTRRRCRHGLGLERHAALRARAGSVCDDVRVHRTGIRGAGCRGQSVARRFPVQVRSRVRQEFPLAVLGAEIVDRLLVLDGARGAFRGDGHPAHGIRRGRCSVHVHHYIIGR